MNQSPPPHQEQGSIYDKISTPLPSWARDYFVQRARALTTELAEIRKLLEEPPMEKTRTRPR